jgi:hypothetical protein
MTVWRTNPVSEEPEIVLSSWSVRELPDGDRHFVGYNFADGGEGRVSSKILEFDPKTLKGKTRSGRVYQLDRHTAGFNTDAEYVWNRWKAINKIKIFEDVTEKVLEEIKNATITTEN